MYMYAYRLYKPHAKLNTPTEATAFIALILTFLGLSDLTATYLPDHTAIEYWSSQTPVRLVFLFCVTAYTYLFKSDGMLGSGISLYSKDSGNNLKNGLVFSWGFMEVSAWFWVYLLLRDERRNAAIRIMEQRAAQEDRM
ncbi:hypothetical protein LTR66_004295 [Elasticomyces elasticus]|nr:hypothetical protein LTR28_004077 [Elasticomyces elasticus]KAK4996002.1 hypothetical protein LTR66_004295 [Elasticomyces elasticus]